MEVTQQNNSFSFAFEREFDVPGAKTWMQSHWHHSIYYSLAYVAAVHLAKHYMSSRPAFDLRTPMMVWSAGLAVFSITGSARVFPYITHTLLSRGVYFTICDSTFYQETPTGFWSYIFAVSKLYELGDTAFVILRKQKLGFLHWYHHVTVFIYCWHSYSLGGSCGMTFGFMNFVVHSFMYTYYTLKAMRLPIPRYISMIITVLQLVQMFIGVAIAIAIFHFKRIGQPCAESDANVVFTLGMYFSYVLLFFKFFYQTYLRPRAVLKGENNGLHQIVPTCGLMHAKVD